MKYLLTLLFGTSYYTGVVIKVPEYSSIITIQVEERHFVHIRSFDTLSIGDTVQIDKKTLKIL